MKFDGIIFDLDGTLWDTVDIVCDVWNMITEEHNIKTKVEPEVLKGYMGMQAYEIAERLFPDINKELAHQMIDECCRRENDYLIDGGALLYPKLEEILAQLSKNYKLFIVSNCQDGYIQTFLKTHNMGKYFTDFICAGSTGMSKGENNKIILERNGIKRGIYVGDTQGDAQSAKIADIPFVFAKYGFGNVENPDYVIEEFEDLLEIF